MFGLLQDLRRKPFIALVFQHRRPLFLYLPGTLFMFRKPRVPEAIYSCSSMFKRNSITFQTSVLKKGIQPNVSKAVLIHLMSSNSYF